MLGGLFASTAITAIATEFIHPSDGIALVSAGFFMASSTVTALLPDVDEKNSTAGRKLIAIPVTLAILKITLFMIEMFSFGYIRKKLKETRKALNHRGIFHWLITWGILSLITVGTGLIVYFSLNKTSYRAFIPLILSVMAGFIVGYISHLPLDLISGRIQLLAPFNKKWYGIRLVETGSLFEKLIVRPLIIAAVIGLLYLITK